MTKNEVLAQLEERRGGFLSGEVIASALNITRAAVSKAVSSLRKDGYPIESVTGLGYRIPSDSGVLSLSLIEKYLSSPYRITLKDSTGSTNSDLREIAADAPEFTVIASRSQSGGRGRMGRQFYSPSDSGFYFSILLRPQESAEDATFITAAAAVAVSQAIEKTAGKSAAIKWVNDVFVQSKKVCGILTEAAFDMENGRFSYVILGVGLNLCTPEGGFPDGIKHVAGSIFENADADLKARLIACVLDRFYELYSCKGGILYNEYLSRCFVIGSAVTVVRGSETYPAKITGLDGRFRLLVERENGVKEALSSGEISLRL